MNFLLALSFLLGSAQALAQAPPLPDFCETDQNCRPLMAAILGEFKASGPLNVTTLPRVASGACYHLDAASDGDQAEFGYFFLDNKEASVFADAAFGFNFPENPYAKIGLTEARSNASDIYSDYRRVEINSSFAYINFAPGNSSAAQFQYWIRQSGESLIVLALWGSDHEVFCRLEKNP